MDLVTSLPQTAAGYDAVFTVVDRFSKLVKFTPCTSTIGAAEASSTIYGSDCMSMGSTKEDSK